MRKLLKKLKNENKGVALVLVLLIAAFVSMLVSVILLASVANSNMKKDDKLGDDNFQVADSAIEELTMGLEEVADNAMREAFTYMLQVYSATVQNQRLEKLKDAFALKMEEKIKSSTNVLGGKKYVDMTKLKALITGASNGNVTVESAVSGDTAPVYEIRADKSVVVKNVKLKYLDNKNYETVITTDICFQVPANLVDISKMSDSIDYNTYGLITDGSIIRDSSGTNDFTVSANVYAGKNITVKSAKLKLTGEYVVSRGTLEAIDMGIIDLPDANTNLWVKNIATVTDSFIPLGHHTWINLGCNAYVADDLTLGADYADVKITGKYYGYHTSNSTSNSGGTASGSSAIIINAKNAKLDMEQASYVAIAGKAFISVPNYYSKLTNDQLSTFGLTLTSGAAGVGMGESLSFKGIQSSYMVPGDCVIGIGHNPMTPEEFNKITKNGSIRVDVGQNYKNGGIDLLEYCDQTKTYVAHNVQYINEQGVATTMVYLYLNFTSPDKAADYFAKYYNKYGARVQNLANYLKLGEILMSANYINTGNMITKDSSGNVTVLNKSLSYADSVIVKNEISFSRKYNGLITYLDSSYFTNDVNTPAGELLIHFKSDTVDTSGLIYQTAPALAEGYMGNVITKDDPSHLATDKHPFVLITPYDVKLEKIGNKYYVSQSGTGAPAGSYELIDAEGLILSGGKITVNNVSFNGLLFAKNNVVLEGTATISNVSFGANKYHYIYEERDSEGNIIDANKDGYLQNVEDLIKHDQRIYKWFKTYSPSGIDDTEGYSLNSVRIVFENWTKNK